MLKELGLTITGTTDIEGIRDHAETLDVCVTDIYWLGEKRTNIEIIINEGEDFLLGTGLLKETELYINYKTGEVVINQIFNSFFYLFVRIQRIHRWIVKATD